MASDIEIGENVQPEVSSTDSTDDLILFIKERDDEKKVLSPNVLADGMRNTLGLKLNLTELWSSFSFTGCFNKMACVGFFSSLFNIGSDYFLSYSFIFGTNYTKTVNDTMDSAVTNYTCTHIETNFKFDNLTEETKTSYTFNCHESDPIWGGITLAIITSKEGSILVLEGLHKLRLPEEGGRWSKKLTFCKLLYHNKM